jgi:hypothetical protein
VIAIVGSFVALPFWKGRAMADSDAAGAALRTAIRY